MHSISSQSSGSSAIKQMKTITSHLHDSRDLLLKSLDQLSHINEDIFNLINYSQAFLIHQRISNAQTICMMTMMKKQRSPHFTFHN